MTKEIIEKTLDDFRRNYSVIKEIDHYRYIKSNFLGCYTESPKNKVEECFNEFVIEYNKICSDYIKKYRKIKGKNVEDFKKYAELIVKIEKSFILLKKEHSGAYSIIPDRNLLRSTDFSDIADKLSNLHSEYAFKKYPKACDELIEALELKAFTFLTGITEEKLFEKFKQKTNTSRVKKQLSSSMEEF